MSQQSKPFEQRREIPECPNYVAHPQSVWFEIHWRPIIDALKQENEALIKERTAYRTLKSLMADNAEVCELHDDIEALEAKLSEAQRIEKEAREMYARLRVDVTPISHERDKLQNEFEKAQREILELKETCVEHGMFKVDTEISNAMMFGQKDSPMAKAVLGMREAVNVYVTHAERYRCSFGNTEIEMQMIDARNDLTEALTTFDWLVKGEE